MSRVTQAPRGSVTISGGFWARRRHVNRATSLLHGYDQLEAAGNHANFREAAQGVTSAPTRGLPVFDSDVYKWLEAVGWELGTEPDDTVLRGLGESTIKLLQSAQADDGYIGSWYRTTSSRFSDLPSGLELYGAGHLFEAGVAWLRGPGDDRLLEVATRFADHIGTVFGRGLRKGIPEHPGIELALVEVFRATGRESYLELAKFFLEERGHVLLTGGDFGPRYRQDDVPFRHSRTARGHSVMAAYLACGAVDVFLETGDRGLLDAAVAQWEDMVGCRMYVTGGVGSRHKDEAFGDPFELPPDRAYAETCAAIGVVMWSWRLLLATGEPRYADVIERVLFNAFAAGVSLDGRSYFYVNPLQVRAGHQDAEDGRGRAARSGWYQIACCPPNVMRLLSSLDRYFATVTDGGVQIWQYAPSRLSVTVAGQPAELAVRTGYPFEGRVSVRVERAADGPFEIALRVPAWAAGARGRLAPAGAAGGPDTGGRPLEAGTVWRSVRRWRPGDELVLDLPMPARAMVADPRIDAVRGGVAVQRGPLVYCLEQADTGTAQRLESIRLPAGTRFRDGTLSLADEQVPTLDCTAWIRQLPATAAGTLPYHPAESPDDPPGPGDTPAAIRLIPYLAWGNRHPGQAMRIWIPTT